MERSMKDQILDARKEEEVAFISIYNDGSKRNDTYGCIKRMNSLCTDSSVYEIKRMIMDAANSYVAGNDSDFVEMHFIIGLLYDTDNFDSEYNLKPNAVPLKNMIRIWDGPVVVYKDGELKYSSAGKGFPRGFQHFANYEELIKDLEKLGMKFEGPRTFEELKEAIDSKEPFDIKTSVALIEKESTKQQDELQNIELEEPHQEQGLIRRLFKKRR